MRFFAVAAATVLSVVSAQQTWDILVGFENKLVFKPEVISAAQGDKVVFTFTSKNHTATQSSFASPCEPLAGGLQSGYQPAPNTSATFPQWSFTVTNASAPIWFYCAQKNPADHCRNGMVFAINPTAEKTFQLFKGTATGNTQPANGTDSAAGAQPSNSASLVSINSAAVLTVLGLIAGLTL